MEACLNSQCCKKQREGFPQSKQTSQTLQNGELWVQQEVLPWNTKVGSTSGRHVTSTLVLHTRAPLHIYAPMHSQTCIHTTHTYMFKKETEMQWLIYRGISWLHITMNIWVVFFNDKSWQFKNASGSYTLKCNPYYFFKFLCYLLYCFWWRTGILFSVRISLELRWF